jgi:hypothetical protein
VVSAAAARMGGEQIQSHAQKYHRTKEEKKNGGNVKSNHEREPRERDGQRGKFSSSRINEIVCAGLLQAEVQGVDARALFNGCPFERGD